jgi:hypothetical protein
MRAKVFSVLLPAFFCLATVFLAGCSKTAEEAQTPAAEPSNETSVVIAPAPVTAPVTEGTRSASDDPDADAAWAELVNAARQPSIPASWTNENPPSDEEMEAYRLSGIEKAKMAVALAQEFYAKYPDNRNANAARGLEENMLRNLANLGDAEASEQVTVLNEKLANDPNISKIQRLQLRYDLLQSELVKVQTDIPLLADMYYAGAMELKNDFPEIEELNGVLVAALDVNYRAERKENAVALVEVLETVSDQKIAENPEDYQSYRFNIDAASKAVLGRDFETANRILTKLKSGNLPKEITQMI